jgi:hypothetical protein
LCAFGVGVQLVGVLLAASAGAQSTAGTSADDTAAEHFERGVSLFDGGNYPMALAEFLASFDAAPTAVALWNVAMTYKMLFRYDESIAAFQRWMALRGEGITQDEEAEVGRLVAEMEANVAVVTIETDAAGAALFVDGREVGSAPLPAAVRLVAGRHVVSARPPGGPPVEQTLTVAPGQPFRVFLATRPPGRVVVSCAAGQATLLVDGARVTAAFPYAAELPAGSHVIRVEAPGFWPYERAIDVLSGSEQAFDITLERRPPEEPQPATGRDGHVVGAVGRAGSGPATAGAGGAGQRTEAAVPADDRDAGLAAPHGGVAGRLLVGMGGAAGMDHERAGPAMLVGGSVGWRQFPNLVAEFDLRLLRHSYEPRLIPFHYLSEGEASTTLLEGLVGMSWHVLAGGRWDPWIGGAAGYAVWFGPLESSESAPGMSTILHAPVVRVHLGCDAFATRHLAFGFGVGVDVPFWVGGCDAAGDCGSLSDVQASSDRLPSVYWWFAFGISVYFDDGAGEP